MPPGIFHVDGEAILDRVGEGVRMTVHLAQETTPRPAPGRRWRPNPPEPALQRPLETIVAERRALWIVPELDPGSQMPLIFHGQMVN
jgi:hypothetical protein